MPHRWSASRSRNGSPLRLVEREVGGAGEREGDAAEAEALRALRLETRQAAVAHVSSELGSSGMSAAYD